VFCRPRYLDADRSARPVSPRSPVRFDVNEHAPLRAHDAIGCSKCSEFSISSAACCATPNGGGSVFHPSCRAFWRTERLCCAWLALHSSSITFRRPRSSNRPRWSCCLRIGLGRGRHAAPWTSLRGERLFRRDLANGSVLTWSKAQSRLLALTVVAGGWPRGRLREQFVRATPQDHRKPCWHARAGGRPRVDRWGSAARLPRLCVEDASSSISSPALRRFATLSVALQVLARLARLHPFTILTTNSAAEYLQNRITEIQACEHIGTARRRSAAYRARLASAARPEPHYKGTAFAGAACFVGGATGWLVSPLSRGARLSGLRGDPNRTCVPGKAGAGEFRASRAARPTTQTRNSAKSAARRPRRIACAWRSSPTILGRTLRGCGSPRPCVNMGTVPEN